MATYKKSKKSADTGLSGKPCVEGQPPDLRSKLMAAYQRMEYGTSKNPTENNTPTYPTKKKAK